MIAMILLVLMMVVAVIAWETCMYHSSDVEETPVVDAPPAE
ncbi:hypothetical protein [Nonomuraea soli]|uniref:Uncharacterized protein n=1 Tax=Nonomuraea soli TaxID=1032476 RepID=A0A7W0HU19_9ACTN|nr:hypothetical protein [Nonomuraea soli]MBA2895615.1 hypothetical protein [Nonomuraea soli]